MPKRWQIEPGSKVSLAKIDSSSVAHAPGGKQAVEALLPDAHELLAGYQDKLWAQSTSSLLVVLQAMDSGGKDGTIKHVFSGVNPQGTRVISFKVPTPAEAKHDFLWRIHAAVPAAGEIAIFNRSHYEDVLAPRVHHLVDGNIWRARYDAINDFEDVLARRGTTIVKIFLHVSKDEQRRRLQERIDTPDKRWKLSQADIEERSYWDEYQAAYEEAIERTTTHLAPWHVIPSDHKWYRNWAVSQVLIGTLAKIAPQYPEPPELATDTVR